MRIGLHYARQDRKMYHSAKLKLDLLSGFIVFNALEKLAIFTRIDKMFDANPEGNKISFIPFDPTAKATLILGGLDYFPVKDVHFMPNIEIVQYDKNDAGEIPKTDIIPRFTFFYKFK